jgi:hypothetical protein
LSLQREVFRGIDINVDADGKTDIAVVNNSANSFSILQKYDYGGVLSFKGRFYYGHQPLYVVLRDIDGDGKVDAAITNQSSNNVSIFRNTSSAEAPFPLQQNRILLRAVHPLVLLQEILMVK